MTGPTGRIGPTGPSPGTGRDGQHAGKVGETAADLRGAEPLAPGDRRLATRAGGLLAEFNRAGVLEAADVHVATRLGVLTGEADSSALLAVALTVRAARAGAVCVRLPDVATQLAVGADPAVSALPWPDPSTWTTTVEASHLVAQGVLRLDHGLLYLDRHWREEEHVCRDLMHRLSRRPPEIEEGALAASAARLFPAGWEEQQAAALAATRQWTTVLTGGPGTGKTASVARMLALIIEQHELASHQPARIALAAPTGKAAMRLQESVAREAAVLPRDADRQWLAGLTASTLHRLLGFRAENHNRFRHHRRNPLPYDVVVVDEVSMVSLAHMARLLEAVRDGTRLVLVGDPGQLASVEAGAVLADLVRGFEVQAGHAVSPVTSPVTSPVIGPVIGPVVSLSRTHRTRAADGSSGVELDELAAALRSGDADAALEVLTSGSPAVRLVNPENPDAMGGVQREVTQAALAVTEHAVGYTGPEQDRLLADLLDEHRLLCAHREGHYGVGGWNRQVQRLVAERTGVTHYDEWYAGRPVLITTNDRGLGLSNGDLGVTVRLPDGRLRVLVRLGNVSKLFAPTRLSGVETVFAMTVHKSQGSEARRVTVILPPEDSRLLTRELFYTAVTRAREQVTIVGTETELRAAIRRQVQRASGLQLRLKRALGTTE